MLFLPNQVTLYAIGMQLRLKGGARRHSATGNLRCQKFSRIHLRADCIAVILASSERFPAMDDRHHRARWK
jgi:hypothetical protein